MLDVDTKALRAKIEEIILELVPVDAEGTAKMKSVVHQAAVFLASKTKGIPDVLEIPLYQAILWLPCQFVFDHLKQSGRIS